MHSGGTTTIAGTTGTVTGGAPSSGSGGTSTTTGGAGGSFVGGAGNAGTTASAGTSAGGTNDPASGGSDAGGATSGAAGDGGSAGSSGDAGAGGQGGGAGSAGDAHPVTIDISKVWSGHPVGFYLLTHQDKQFVAFYDADRRLTVGARTLGEPKFEFAQLDTSVGWDSHNYVVLAVDADGFVHLAGNMHSSPLIYYRTTNPLNIHTFQKQSSMVGMQEDKCTYPQFFVSKSGELIFMYRHGESGNGNHIFNAYSTSTKTWRRLLGSALTDGQGQMNAYPVGPILGPDDFWHLVWVWRDTPDAATNHDVSYARTKDLLNWENAAGQEIQLPIRIGPATIVDPVKTGEGMINNNTKVGFDAQKRPIVAYHKFDANGNTQLYNARFETDKWVVYKTSDWNYRWEFGGGGTLVFDIVVEPVELQPDGTLTQNWYHAKLGGKGAFRLNPDTLAAEATIPQPVPYPDDLADVESPTEGMEVQWFEDAGKNPDADFVYMLRWETLPSNRDQPRPTIPPPTDLRLHSFPIAR